MDWVFIKTCTVRPRFSPTVPILRNIQSSSSGLNIITSEFATNPIVTASNKVGKKGFNAI